MKIQNCLAAVLMICCIHAGSVQAQCTGSYTTTLLTYDSTVNGFGNSPYNFTFPEFDPSLGTLIEVRIQSVISLNYNFTLENSVTTPTTNVRHRLYRLDDIYSSAFAAPISEEHESPNYGPYNLAANNGVAGSGPDFVSVGPLTVFNNDTVVNSVLTNTADFMGPGNVTFDYYSSPGTGFSGGAPFYSNTITDVVKFNITYVYCNTLVLTSNSINLSAQSLGSNSALIKWNTSNESQAKSYEVMVSADGINFTTAAILPASGVSVNDIGNYQFKYDLPSPATKLFFRIKQVTKDNKVSVSAIRPVNWTTKATEIVFVPDPSGTYLSVQLPSSGSSSWQVALYSINGQIIQTNYITASTATSLPIKQKLSKGIYVVRATNTSTKESITQKLFIQ